MSRPRSAYSILGLPRPSRQLFLILRGPYSQEELARALRTSPQTIGDWERRRTDPQLHHMRALVEHYRAWARRLGADPLKLGIHPAPLRTPRARQEDLTGTGAAPPLTAANRNTSSPSPPTLTEGGEKIVVDNQPGGTP